MPPARPGNDIQPLIDGPATFKEMADVISTAVTVTHYIYLIGWSLIDDFQLVNGEENTTMISLLQRGF